MKMEERGPFTTTLTPPVEKDLAISIELPRPTTVIEVEEHNQAVRRQSADRVCYRQLCSRCGERGRFAPTSCAAVVCGCSWNTRSCA